MRKLTVSTLRRQWGKIYQPRYGTVPAIRLNGNWLADAGFTPGQRVDVAIDFSSPTTALIITKENPQ